MLLVCTYKTFPRTLTDASVHSLNMLPTIPRVAPSHPSSKTWNKVTPSRWTRDPEEAVVRSRQTVARRDRVTICLTTECIMVTEPVLETSRLRWAILKASFIGWRKNSWLNPRLVGCQANADYFAGTLWLGVTVGPRLESQ